MGTLLGTRGINGTRISGRNRAFAKNLRIAMRARKLSVSDAAEALGLAVESISRYATGRTLPRSARLGQLARLLGVKEKDLMDKTHTDPKAFGRWLFSQMLERGWTQKDLADRAEVLSESVSAYLDGRHLPSAKNRAKIEEVLANNKPGAAVD